LGNPVFGLQLRIHQNELQNLARDNHERDTDANKDPSAVLDWLAARQFGYFRVDGWLDHVVQKARTPSAE
jgi:hypothetical protein